MRAMDSITWPSFSRTQSLMSRGMAADLARPVSLRVRSRARMVEAEILAEYRGWWRIVSTSQWVDDGLDDLGMALLSIDSGERDRLRMHCLLAFVDCTPTKAGVSFTWEGAWEFDQVQGRGHVKLGRDGRIHGKIRIEDGDESTFIAERTAAPTDPIPPPPSYRDKWRRRW